jgi:hypothetical protein
MSANHVISRNPDRPLENFAAELANAAYRLALRHGIRGSWIQLELGFWRALAEAVQKWTRQWPPAGSSEEFKVWREGLLVDVTESAFHVAVNHGIQGSFLEVELSLYRAFRAVIERSVGGRRYEATPPAPETIEGLRLRPRSLRAWEGR